MNLMRRMARSVSGILLLAFALLSVQWPAQAAMVGTDAVLVQQQGTLDRGQLLEALAREDVRVQLQALGVNPAEARARIAALSDAELQSLAGKLHELPAGGDVLGLAVFLFLVLLVTVILGFTDIFPFVKKTVR